MLDWKIRKKIEWAFYNYNTLKQRAKEYICDIASEGLTARYGVAGSSNGYSNPTENKALSAASQNDEAWCKVVEHTFEQFKYEPLKTKLIKYRYDKGLSVRQLCDNYNNEFFVFEEKTFYNWINEILTYAAMVAIQERLIKV